jgi:protein-S-isoprenylcysteine O-methyltransferase Ste14
VNARGGSLAAFVVLALTVAAMLLVRTLVADGAPGIAIQVGAVALMVWARWTFGRRSFHAGANPTEGGLVTTGPYRFLRHPIYTAVLLFVWAGVLTHLSLLSLTLGTIATAATAVRMIAEERLVLLRYPEYRQYAERTKRVIPFIF